MGKKSRFVSTFRRICTIFTEHRRRLNNKKRKNFVFSFLLSSTCTSLQKIGGASTIKKTKKLRLFFFIVFDLHYLCTHETIGGDSCL